MKCKICNEDTSDILSIDSKFSVSSLGKILEAKAQIFLCPNCSHCQTLPSIDLFEYYSNEYKTLSVSFDEDDLYSMENDKPVYRNFHMAKTLINKFNIIDKSCIDQGMILDFGCGKSLVMKRLMEMTQSKNIYLFDVSQDYIKFWDSFVPNSQYSCFELPAKWNDYFSLVTSFFSMEHVDDALLELKRIRQLLRKTGYVYIIVPNMYSENVSDMVVIDHVHHYSESSMNMLFYLCDFEMIVADHHSHTQGSIYIAKPISKAINDTINTIKRDESLVNCLKIAAFWKAINSSILRFEEDMKDSGVSSYYIIGAGFFGTYVFLQLKYPERLEGFIDSNGYKQNKGWQGKKVFLPGTISWDSSKAVLSGFNKIQINTILPGMMPSGTPLENVWTLENVTDYN